MSVIGELREKEIEYCREHLEYFIDNYGHIEDKDNKENIIQPFKMWPAQREALNSIANNKLNAILKARQLGITWLVLHYAVWLMLCFPGRTVIALSQKEEDAKELVRRVAEVILFSMGSLIVEAKRAPANWQGATYTYNQLEVVIKFPNGVKSKFTGMASSPGAGRSWTANLIILDEWAFQPNAEEIYSAGFPTVNRPTGGQLVGLSTIDRGTFFERIYTDPDNNFNKIFIPWYADPNRDEVWYENTKKGMGDLITQEYPASIEEALTVPGGSFFPEVNEKNTITKEPLENKRKVIRYVAIDYGLDMFSAHWIAVDTFGNAQVYREYDSPNKTIAEACAILVDLCEGEEIEQYLAPPDLWNRRQETGKSASYIFSENGVNLTKTNNDLLNGCLAMKEWLRPQGEMKSKLTILDGEAPNLYNCLKKIQKDKRKPNIYAKQPHDLTHDVDSLRCFCIYWTLTAQEDKESKKKTWWTEDRIEDWRNATDEEREYLESKYGEPIL